jgi:hypothetical protein
MIAEANMKRLLPLPTLLVFLSLGACSSKTLSTNDASVTDDGGVVDNDSGIFDNDGGTVEPTGDGGAPLTGDAGVGALLCGTTPCNTASGNVCCFTTTFSLDLGPSATATCEPQTSCMGIQRSCDGPEDCSSGMALCCIGLAGTTSCRATCPFGEPEACHAKTDCPAPPANRVAACCPASATLRYCRTYGNASNVPATCN